MAKRILLAAVVLMVGLAAYVGVQAPGYKVTRSTSVAAPPAAVYALFSNFHNWDSWSPWAKLDPNMRTTYAGPESGTGASYSWTGNDKVGEGRMTVLDSVPDQSVRIKLEFLKPFPSTSITEIVVKPEGTGAAVTWTMTGENNFLGRLAMLFMGGMDKAVGPDFERGLAQMKALAEARK